MTALLDRRWLSSVPGAEEAPTAPKVKYKTSLDFHAMKLELDRSNNIGITFPHLHILSQSPIICCRQASLPTTFPYTSPTSIAMPGSRPTTPQSRPTTPTRASVNVPMGAVAFIDSRSGAWVRYECVNGTRTSTGTATQNAGLRTTGMTTCFTVMLVGTGGAVLCRTLIRVLFGPFSLFHAPETLHPLLNCSRCFPTCYIRRINS